MSLISIDYGSLPSIDVLLKEVRRCDSMAYGAYRDLTFESSKKYLAVCNLQVEKSGYGETASFSIAYVIDKGNFSVLYDDSGQISISKINDTTFRFTNTNTSNEHCFTILAFELS